KGIVRYPSGDPGVGDAERILPDKHINVFMEDSKLRVWIGTAQGLYWASGSAEPLMRPELNRESITAISEDSTGRIWIGGLNGKIWIVARDRVAAIGPE